MKLVVQRAPINTFHLASILYECKFHPIYYIIEVHPKFICIWVVLMFAHILLDLPFANPLYCRFEIFLTNTSAIKIIACYSISHTTSFTKMTFSIRYPRTAIDRITQLLFCEFFACNIDYFKPIKLFFIIPFTYIYH